MKKLTLVCCLLASTALAPNSALAQDSGSSDVLQQIAELKAEVLRLSSQVSLLEAQQRQQQAETAQAAEVASTAAADAAAASATAAKAEETASAAGAGAINWKGAPQFKGPGGWSFKPRGRLQVDAGLVSAPASTGRTDGFGSEMRRVRLGVEGDIPGGFGYKFEFDFAGNSAEVTDAVLTYEHGGFELVAGQHNNYQSLEELTSSRFSSFIERAAFTDAFGFERRLGLSGKYSAGDVLLQAGVFTDNIGDLPSKDWGADWRVVFMPKLGDAQLHLAGSVHYAEINGGGDLRYRQRPLVHFTGERFVNTGNFSAQSEFGTGLEAAVISGRFHAVGEAYWQNVDRPGALADPSFFGGYAEAGFFLTDDTRGYKNGIFDRVKPSSPVGEGGMGALQVNFRYDYLDLVDSGIVGGMQNGYFASLIWTPTDYTRLMLNYGHLEYDQAIYATGTGATSYGVDTVAVRGQVDF